MGYHPVQASVIIMNLNRQQMMTDCVEFVLQYTQDVPYELIIVDAGSTDGSRAHLITEYSTRATLIFDDQRYCYAVSNNRAARLSRGKYIAMLNNDCLATPQWLSIAVRAMENDPTIGQLAHLVLRGDRYSIMSHGANLLGNGDTTIPLCQSNLSDPRWKQPGNYAYAGFGIYRRDLFTQIGGICEEYDNPPSYFQDTHYGMMMNMLGYDVRYCPESAIIHHMDHSERGHFNKALEQGRRPFMKHWGAFLAENGGYAPPYPKNDGIRPYIQS